MGLHSGHGLWKQIPKLSHLAIMYTGNIDCALAPFLAIPSLTPLIWTPSDRKDTPVLLPLRAAFLGSVLGRSFNGDTVSILFLIF